MSNAYPAIPDPQNNVESLGDTVRALKMAVETLVGQRAGGMAARVFEQAFEPTNPRGGDIWLVSNDAGTVRIWNGHFWLEASSSGSGDGGGGEAASLSEAALATVTDAINPELAALNAQITDALAQTKKITVEINRQVDIARTEFQDTVDAVQGSLRTDIQSASATLYNSVLTEADARAIEDTLLSGRIDTVQASAAANAAAITVEQGVRATADDAVAARVTTLETSVTSPTGTGVLARLVTEEATRATADTGLASRITTLESSVTNTTGSGVLARLITEEGTRATADTALSNRVTTVESSVTNTTGSGVLARLITEEGTRATADTALSGRVVSLESSVTNTTGSGVLARLITEEVARASADSGLSGRITTVEASTTNTTGTGVLARLITEEGARASADTAITGRVQTLESSVTDPNSGGLLARVVTEEATRATKDSALAGFVTKVSAGASGVYVQDTDPTGMVTGATWLKPSENYKPYYYNGSTWLDNSNGVYPIGKVADVQSQVTAEILARTTGDTALATYITRSSVGSGPVYVQNSAPSSPSVGAIWYSTASVSDPYRPYYWNGSAWLDNSSGTYGSVATISSSLSSVQNKVDNTLGVQWAVQANINNSTGGLSFTGVKKADGTGALYTFEIGDSTGNSQTAVKIYGNAVVDGTLGANKITTNSLSAITANLGTITAGVMQSTDGKFVIDLTNRTITISD